MKKMHCWILVMSDETYVNCVKVENTIQVVRDGEVESIPVVGDFDFELDLSSGAIPGVRRNGVFYPLHEDEAEEDEMFCMKLDEPKGRVDVPLTDDENAYALIMSIEQVCAMMQIINQTKYSLAALGQKGAYEEVSSLHSHMHNALAEATKVVPISSLAESADLSSD